MSVHLRLELIVWIVFVGGAYGFGLLLRDLWRLVRHFRRSKTLEEQLAPWTNRTGDN